MTNFTNSELIAARMEEFKSRDQEGIAVAATAAEEKSPALASSGDGSLLLVYELHTGDKVIVTARLLRTK